MITTHRAFKPPRTVIGYGFDADSEPIEELRSTSGYLLGHEALDDHKAALLNRRPDMYVVAGEYTREDGMHYPELQVSEAWMIWKGYRREGRRWIR